MSAMMSYKEVIQRAIGTNLTSCVTDKFSLPEFQVLKARIRPKGFVAESKTYFHETDNESEAHYLCATLNSNVVNELIKPLQTRGLFGERDIGRRPFMLPIPKFDRNSPPHLKLAELSKKCHAKIASIKFTKRSTAGLREEARDINREELMEIDKLVWELLGISK